MAPTLAALVARNDVLEHNPPPGDIHITARGSDWLWTVTAIDFLSLLIFLCLLYKTPRTDRIFHYLTVLIIIVTGISYYTMASDIGSMAIPVEWVRSGHTVAGKARQVFWIRYLDWFFTSPMIIMNLLLTAGVYWHTILYTMLLEIVYVILLLVGAIVPDTYRWGYFTLAMVALFLVLENLVWAGFRHARAMGGNISKLYMVLTGSIVILWILYPISWGCSEGGNVIAPDSEQIFYGILDVLSKPILGFVLILGHMKIDINELDLRLYDRVGNEGGERGRAYTEKENHNNNDNAGNGNNNPALATAAGTTSANVTSPV